MNDSDSQFADLPLFARLRKNAAGETVVAEIHYAAEVGPSDAARILGCSQSHLNNLVEYLDANSIIRWRWIGHEGSGGKRLYNTASLMAYRESKRGGLESSSSHQGV